jgi:outer membrane protein
MKKILILLLMLLSMFILNTITLEESIELAKKNNKELLAEKSGLSSVEWAKKNALTNFLPKASFNSTMVRIDNETYDQANEIFDIPVFNSMGIPTGDVIPFSAGAMSGGFYKTSYQNSFVVQQPVFNGGKVILGYQMAELAKQQAKLAFDNKRKDISYSVASTYLGILKLQDLKTLSQKSLNSTLSHLEMALKKYDVGTAKKSDVLQWQVKMKNAETSIIELENGINEMFGFWQNLLGVSGIQEPQKIDVRDYEAEIITCANYNRTELDTSAEEFLKQVNSSSPTILSLGLINKMMKKNLLMAKGEFLPNFNMQFSYQIENDDKFDFDGEDNWNLAAVLSWPIFTSGKNYTNLVKTKYDMKKAKYETEAMQENYLVAARNVFNRLVTKARVVEDNKIALEFARENHTIIGDLFKQGLVTNTELLDAETMLFGSEMQLVSAYYDFILIKYEMQKYTSRM